MTLENLRTIERIVRGSCCFPEDVEFESWLGVDQEQALALIDRIPDKLPCGPLRNPFEGYHLCEHAGCNVSVGPKSSHCWEHGGQL